MKNNDYFSDKKCDICGDNVSGVNYGVLTCESCKIFFFRNESKNFICTEQSQCVISISTRKNCPSCRLKKCFTVGMKKTFNNKNNTNYPKKLSLSLELGNCEHSQIVQVQEAVSSAFEDETKYSIMGVVNHHVAIGQLHWPDSYASKVVTFAKSIPALRQLNRDDQLSILRNSIIEILMVRCSFAMDLQMNGYHIVQNEPTKHGLFVRFNSCRNKLIYFLHSEIDNDCVIRDLILALTLFQSHSNVSCPEFIRYQHILYQKLLRIYLSSKYPNKNRAEHKYFQLMSILERLPSYKEYFLRWCLDAKLQQLPELMIEVIPTLPKSTLGV